jgi:hypothetical protein
MRRRPPEHHSEAWLLAPDVPSRARRIQRRVAFLASGFACNPRGGPPQVYLMLLNRRPKSRHAGHVSPNWEVPAASRALSGVAPCLSCGHFGR